MESLACPAGHLNPPENAFCGTCGLVLQPVATASAPEPVPPAPDPQPPIVRFRGHRYSIGWDDAHCYLWDSELAGSNQLETFPKTPQGWDAARAKFDSVEKPRHVQPKPKGRVGGIYSLGVLDGRTLDEITRVLGQPSAYSQMPQGRRLIQWQQASAYGESFHYSFIFEGDVCRGIHHQFVR
jgi:hypothetical protein